MSKRIIDKSHELKEAIEYFNFFHDGFLKSIKLISGNKFGQNPPWEKPSQYESIEEKLLDTGLWFSEKHGLFVEIHHYNYDWPNRSPENKISLYLQNVRNVDPEIVRMVGMPIHNCQPTARESGLAMTFTFNACAGNESRQIELETLEFEKIAIREAN